MKKIKTTINISELAEMIGVSLRTMYNMVGDRRFPVEPISGTEPRRWLRSAVESWLNG